jgi:hypothetical protein
MSEKMKQLCVNYPKIFDDNFYFGCGDGWYKLLNTVCRGIQDSIDHYGYTQFKATQVKEKFGGLRFYGGPTNDIISAWIDCAEIGSLKICETCGEAGSPRGRGYMYTACDKHADEGDRDD